MKHDMQKFRALANLEGITDKQMVADIRQKFPKFTKFDFSKAFGEYGLGLSEAAADILVKKYSNIATRSVKPPASRKRENRQLGVSITLRLAEDEAGRLQLLCNSTGLNRQDMLRYIVNRETDGIESWIDQAAAPLECNGTGEVIYDALPYDG